MRVILIDDEPNCLEMLEILIERYCPDLQIVGQFEDPSVAVDKIPILKPDLVFLDVQMPVLSGFDVIERSRDTPFSVIFTTAYEQYALKAFKYSAIDYLLKPIDKEDLITAVHKARHSHQANYQAEQRNILLDYVNPIKPSKEKVALSTFDGIVFINIKEIVYCESQGNYSKIFMQQGKSFTFTKPLKDVEEMLHENLFFRVHHSFLVNLRKVEKYIRTDGGDIKMTNGKVIPVSRQKKEEVLTALINL